MPNSSGQAPSKTVIRNIGITLTTKRSHQDATCMAIHWQDCFWARRFEEVLLQEDWENVAQKLIVEQVSPPTRRSPCIIGPHTSLVNSFPGRSP